jgi:hypothetical protein
MAGASRNTTPSLRSIEHLDSGQFSLILVHYLGPTSYQFDIMAMARPPNAASLRIHPQARWRHSARIPGRQCRLVCDKSCSTVRGQDLLVCLISKVRLQHCGHFRKPLRYVGSAQAWPALTHQSFEMWLISCLASPCRARQLNRCSYARRLVE